MNTQQLTLCECDVEGGGGSVTKALRQTHEDIVSFRSEAATAITSLPPEIMATIFEIGSWDTWELGIRCSDTMLHVVSQVSQCWRAIAIGTPTLWTKLLVTVGEMASTALLELHLERSRSCYLNVKIATNIFHYRHSELTSHLQIVFCQLDRFRSLSINVSKYHEIADLIAPPLVDACAPNLEFLEVMLIECEHIAPPLFRIFTGGTPSLRSLKLDGIRNFYPPLATIEHLDIGYSREEFDANYLRRLIIDWPTSLKSFALCPRIVDFNINLDVEAVEAQSLLSLGLYGDLVESCSSQRLRDFCANFSAPQITSLQLRHFSKRNTRVLAAALTSPLLVTKYPNLHILEVMDSAISSNRVTEFVAAFPTITTAIFHSTDCSAILEHLCEETDDAASRWPNLHTIAITDTFLAFESEVGLICELVLKRIERGRPLSCVKHKSLSCFAADKYVWLRERVRLESW